MKTKSIILFLLFVTANCFASGNSEVENFKRKYTISMLDDVFSVAINPNGKQIAAGTSNGYKVFDLKTGKELFTFWGYDERRMRFVYSPDGSQIMCPVKNEIKIWDSKTGIELRTLSANNTSDNVSCAVYSPDGKYIAATAATGEWFGVGVSMGDPYIRVWDVNSGQRLSDNMSDMYVGSANFIYYSKDGKTIGASAVGTFDTPDYYSFNAETGEKKNVPMSIFYPISPDGESFDGVFLWDGQNNTWIYSQSKNPKQSQWWSFSPDGLRLARVVKPDDSYHVRLFDAKNYQTLAEYLGNSPLSVEPKIIMYNPQGTRIFAGLADGSIKLWDSTTGQEITTLNYNNIGGISSAQFSKDGNYLVIGTSNGNIILLGK